MKHRKTSSTSPGSSTTSNVADAKKTKKAAQVDRLTAADPVQKIDRPGFDLGGSSEETVAGTGLGLGDDSSDTPGERQLPGRRFDSKLTIPRWGGPAPHGTIEPAKKRSGHEIKSAPSPKKGR